MAAYKHIASFQCMMVSVQSTRTE